MFGAWVIFGMNILMPTMLKAFQANMLAASGQVDVTISHKTGETFSRTLLNKVRTIEGVRAVSGLLSRTINVPDRFFGNSKVTALTLVGLDPHAAQSVRTYQIQEGRFLRADDDLAAVITTSLAESLGVKLGDKLHLPTTEGTVTLEIVGLQPARTLPGNEEVLVTLLEAQKLLDLPNRINTIEANLDTTDAAQRTAIQKSIEGELGQDYTLGGLSSGNEFYASIQMGQAIFNLFGFLALIMGGFIIFNTFRTVVAERTREIGMLRAIGATRPQVRRMVIAEALLLAAIGTAFGLLGGLYLSYVMVLGMSAAGFPAAYSFPFSGLVAATAVGLIFGVLAALVPARQAAGMEIVRALRHE